MERVADVPAHGECNRDPSDFALTNKNLVCCYVCRLIKSRNQDMARAHEEVTVLFADIASFTSMCGQVPSPRVMVFLNDLFTTFDQLVEKHQVYKVETIGGTALYGIVVHIIVRKCTGLSKAYGLQVDHWPPGQHGGGPRMESTGVPGAVHISAATRALLGAAADGFLSTGGIPVEGKGFMLTYVYDPCGVTPQRSQTVSRTGSAEAFNRQMRRKGVGRYPLVLYCIP
ncbi:guanylyl and adenylyl cyclase family member [Volvox carteri f. nagariensis]|uniref:Guanylyl and adenylyl cyclase family member n=1 Tax=Volvox carteri f. nagariensis TaxID=3068 RepID=D8ULC7_VOLCA|nr:guanylyl and adenylyl cyclase family member [Volvox carteri f. nagariensis]EFJ39470.1 guanylyl and adenylyl cyclase family member [Volvox carteri f. nagariensis]|eukprot:XP_002959463.1 guanylyl and adenylyl cyclase family member [Volvox carteri f. nagariensis]